jgi:hypothetical protein
MTISDRTRRPGPCSTCNRTMPRGECPECWPDGSGFDGPDWLYPIAAVAFCAFAGVATALEFAQTLLWNPRSLLRRKAKR